MGLKGTTPEGNGENFISKTQHWDKNPDLTGSLVQDWGVILFFEKYLTDWEAILDSLERDNRKRTKKPQGRRKKHAP
jgi:hypothetical protein